SLDHLNHALASEGPFFPIPPGAETEYVQPPKGPYTPQAFSAEQFRMILRLVEVLRGEDLKDAKGQETAGPGVDEDVARWVDLVVACAPGIRASARRLTPEERALAVAYFGSEEPVVQLEAYEPERVCREGLLWLDEESNQRFAKRFLDAGHSAQVELVGSI